MQAIIDPGILKGTVQAPASKSIMQRVCAAALLHQGKTTITNAGASNDEIATLGIIEQLGARIIRNGNIIEIESSGIRPIAKSIHCGESGLASRLFIPIVSMAKESIEVTGNGSLLHRPLKTMQDALTQLNVGVKTNGYLPFIVTGPLYPQDITINASDSSQFLSGLLFAFAFSASAPVTITVQNLNSRPYIDLTLDILQRFGKPISHDSYKSFYIDPTQFIDVTDIDVNIEGDWSSAAGLLIAGAIAGDVTLTGLNPNSLQADRVLLDVLQSTGAIIIRDQNKVRATRATLTAFDFDATQCPDLFPVLSILASCCKGQSSIRGISRLIHKESNRVQSIADMLLQFGILFSVENDTLVINGAGELEHATIDTYNDHRIVMAASIAALRAAGTIIVNEAEAVNKSYPHFFEDLRSLGAKMYFEHEPV